MRLRRRTLKRTKCKLEQDSWGQKSLQCCYPSLSCLYYPLGRGFVTKIRWFGENIKMISFAHPTMISERVSNLIAWLHNLLFFPKWIPFRLGNGISFCISCWLSSQVGTASAQKCLLTHCPSARGMNLSCTFSKPIKRKKIIHMHDFGGQQFSFLKSKCLLGKCWFGNLICLPLPVL